MEKNSLLNLQEVVFSSKDAAISKQLSRLVAAGKLRKISPRIYTSNFDELPELIIRRNLYLILGKLYPGAILSHRSALEFQPTSAGHIFLTYTYTKKVSLPGVMVRLLEGPGNINGDNPLSGGLYASQLERALLENLQPSRRPGPESKVCLQEEIENRLEQVAYACPQRRLTRRTRHLENREQSGGNANNAPVSGGTFGHPASSAQSAPECPDIQETRPI